MKFKGILLDLDNTLYDYNKAHGAALKAVFSSVESKFSLEQSKLTKAYTQARHSVASNLKYTAASHNRILYFQTMLENCQIYSSQETLSLYDIYWNTFLENMHLFDGAISFLEKVKPEKICVITDLTAHIQHRKIIKLGIEKYESHLVTSEEVGIEKPHPKIFSTALQKLGLNAHEVCMIGDNFAK
ncbi:HAD family hydrolase, partial [Candidatus Babeliales bacterium]|nr:HAD family hydrolase [Candidatus Babeliales bacterium]